MITALCGGVGGAKLVLGLYRLLPPNELTVIVNTADDLEFCGLHISPDLDTVTYTLAGIARHDVGWGIEGDTFTALRMLERYGVPTWFQVGDRDLATDIFRTDLLRRRHTLTAATAAIADALDIQARILPMTDATVTTRLQVEGEWLHFQEYFVHRGHCDPVTAIRYEGIETASPSPATLDALGSAETIVIVNSNPVLSILPILAVPGINEVLVASSARCVAVSPIVGMNSVTGPAGELMTLIGQPSTALGVARAYLGVIDGLVIDRRDAELAAEIEADGVSILCTDIIMRTDSDRTRLAEETLAFAAGLA